MSESDAHGTERTPTLSVLMRVRDEEAMLPGCLRRLDFVDEVVAIVDDRTLDRSVRDSLRSRCPRGHCQF